MRALKIPPCVRNDNSLFICRLSLGGVIASQTTDFCLAFCCRGGVAQLGERLVRNQKASGSIPLPPPH